MASQVSNSQNTSKKQSAKRKTRRRRTGSSPARGRRFTAEQKEHAVEQVLSGKTHAEVARKVGTSAESVRRWFNRYKATAAKSGGAGVSGSGEQSVNLAVIEPEPTVVASSTYAGLSPVEQEAILTMKKKHPSYGPAQIRTQLKRFKGWRISVKAITRLLKRNGYELVHTKSRPKDIEYIRFEAPRPNALWQMDFAELHLAGEKLSLLVALDDFSRFVVGHAVADSQESSVVTATFRTAIARHGKPEAVRTDRGGAFVAKTEPDDFAAVLESDLVDHIVGRAYHPQGGGKVESLIGTIRRELWDVEHMPDRETAERRIAEFLEHYNDQRAHMGIGGLTPADKYHGRSERVLGAIDAVARGRHGAWLAQHAECSTSEELLSVKSGAPLEVLRLVLRDGAMELSFCGARTKLGTIE